MSTAGMFGIAVCALVLAACGDDPAMIAPPTTGTAGTLGGTPAAAGTSAAGSTGTAGTMATGAAGRSTGTSGTGAAGRSTGTSGTGAATAGTGAAGTGTAGTGTATAGTGAGTAGMAGSAAGAPAMAGTSGGMAGTGAAGTGGNPPTGASCLDGITNYFEKGPFSFMSMRMGAINFTRPMVPAGCKVPVIHMANGTGASCANYKASTDRMASHGFLAACYESTQTGAGTQGLEAMKTAIEAFPDLADKKFGSTGHSQGGQSSFVVLSLSEKEFGLEGGNKFAGLAMQPASNFGAQPAGGWKAAYAAIKSPMFMFSGKGTDGLVSQGWVQDGFNALDDSIEAYHWTKAGGTHIPVPNGEEMQISIAWFRWKLLGDQAACKAFKAIPMMDSTWTEVASQNKAECQ